MEKKLAVITGASMGLGYEFAKILANKGYDLLLVARSKDKLEQLSKEIKSICKVECYIFECDLAKSNAAEQVFDYLAELKRNCHILINNAGFGYYGMFSEIDARRSEDMIALNISSLTTLTHLALQDMKGYNSGYILNVASTAAFQAGPLMAVYYATKAYVLSLTEALANELSHTRIIVSALCPGPTDTNFQKNASLDGSNLFKILKAPSAKEVAEFGIESMFNGKTVAIHGFVNKILVQSTRISPRKLLAKVVRQLQEKRVG